MLIVIAIIGICFYVNWQGSEAGKVAKAESMLKFDHSKKSILDCLDIAGHLAHEGKSKSAQKIELAVDNAIKTDKSDLNSKAKLYLEIANELSKRGDKEIAFDYAFKALSSLEEITKGGGPSGNQFAMIDEAASLMLQAKKTLDAEQLKSALSLCDRSTDIVERECKDHILDLALKALAANVAAPNDASIRCMFAKNIVLAKSDKLAELDKSLRKSFDTLSTLQSPTAIRKSPDPCYLQHLIDIAAALARTDSIASAKYIDSAEDIYKKVDPSTIDETTQRVLAQCKEKMSEVYVALGNNEKGLDSAREAVRLRPLQDADSAACVNQLLSALLASGKASEADPIASAEYKFFKSQDKSDADLLAQRGACIQQYFAVLIAEKKANQAISMLNSEIKEQKKNLPESALTVINLNCKLADYHLAHNQLKAAAECSKLIDAAAKYLKGDEKLHADILLLTYAVQAKTPAIAVSASRDAIAELNKNHRSDIQQEYISGLCTALDALKKEDNQDTYKQAIDLIRAGFQQQLVSGDADPVALAKVINDLGSSGEEQIADALRSEAKEKLNPAKASVFLSRSMDFVVNGEKDTAQYADPKQAVKVYLDLAHNMLNKDDDAAFKNAFEAMKIMNVLSSKNPELRADFLESIEDAAGIMLQCKQAADADQARVLMRLCTAEAQFLKNSDKDRILDLALAAQSKNDLPVSEDVINLMLLRDENLARRGQVAQLDTQIVKTKHALSSANQIDLAFASHLSSLAEMLNQHHEQLAARRYLSQAKKVLEEISTSNSSPGTNPLTPSTPAQSSPAVDQFKLAEAWNRIATGYAQVGEAQSALICAKKCMSLRPLRDLGSGRYQVNLIDRTIDTGDYGSAEASAADLYRFAKSQAASPDMLALRGMAANRLFKIEKALHKDAQAVAIANEEIEARKSSPNAQPMQTIALYNDLANYYLTNNDAASIATCLNGIKQAKDTLKADQKSAFEHSSMQRDLINLALKVNDEKLASTALTEMTAYRDLDRAMAIKSPQKWWATALNTFKKADDQKAYKQTVDLIKDGCSQQLSRNAADPTFIADAINELGNAGEDKAATQLLNDAQKRFQANAREIFNARCKYTAPQTAPSAKTDATNSATPVSNDAQKPNERGRIDADQ